jgi:hypothetical protein
METSTIYPPEPPLKMKEVAISKDVGNNITISNKKDDDYVPNWVMTYECKSEVSFRTKNVLIKENGKVIGYKVCYVKIK